MTHPSHLLKKLKKKLKKISKIVKFQVLIQSFTYKIKKKINFFFAQPSPFHILKTEKISKIVYKKSN
jgi:hypothetical protein